MIIVRPTGIGADDERWTQTIERWRTNVSRVAGSTVQILEVAVAEVASKLSGGAQLWLDVHRDGQLVFGQRLDELADPVSA